MNSIDKKVLKNISIYRKIQKVYEKVEQVNKK
jgi:hypothetical protein